MTAIQLALLTVIAAPFVLAVWIAMLHGPPISAPADAGLVDSSGPPAFDPAITGGNALAGVFDVARRAAADSTAGLARGHPIRINVAVSPKIEVTFNPSILRMALAETMLTALRSTPTGRVLVTATCPGDHLVIRVTDDGAGQDLVIREALALETAESIGPRGGSVGIEASPGLGTTVTIKLPLIVCPDTRSDDVKGSLALADQAA